MLGNLLEIPYSILLFRYVLVTVILFIFLVDSHVVYNFVNHVDDILTNSIRSFYWYLAVYFLG